MKALIVILLFACSVASASEPDVTGAYRYGGGIHVIRLALLPNGVYLAQMDLDIYPEAGRSSGTWSRVGEEVRLIPKKEEGDLAGYLTVLLIRTVEGKKALLRREDIEHEPNPFFYFYMKQSPNQSPQTRITSHAKSAYAYSSSGCSCLS